jgi:tetraacyldisaccharide 4'-kinase
MPRIARRTLEQYHRDVIGGAERGTLATIMRGALRAVEPSYASAVSLRNYGYDRGFFTSHRAARPVISVGNITTGGTGKTPVVRWLAQRLLAAGLRPAVLLRGYKGGDEARLLQNELPELIVEEDPSRIRAARHLVQVVPEIDVFVLDDGFQHRRLRRDFDLVLIDQSSPFGFYHVLPRGLLREPLAGLRRATAFLLTRTDLGEMSGTEVLLRRFNAQAPIYRCRHLHTALRSPDGMRAELSELRGRSVLAFCGIANPAAFVRQLGQVAGAGRVASHWFGDHHRYSPADLSILREVSRQVGAEIIVTTEKDWVKLAAMRHLLPGIPPLFRVELEIRFEGDDETRLLEQIIRTIESSSPRSRGDGSALRATAGSGSALGGGSA